MQALDETRAFRCRTDAFQPSVGGTLTQIAENGQQHVEAFVYERLSATEENYSAEDSELFCLLYFLWRSRRYLERTELEVLTDNQVLKRFFEGRPLTTHSALARMFRTGWDQSAFIGQKKSPCPRLCTGLGTSH